MSWAQLSGCAGNKELETPINMSHLHFNGVSTQKSFSCQYDLRVIYWGPKPIDLVLDAKITNIGTADITTESLRDKIDVMTSNQRKYPIRPQHTMDYDSIIQPNETKEITLKIQAKSLINYAKTTRIASVYHRIESISEECTALRPTENTPNHQL